MLMAMHLGPRARKALRYVGIAIGAVIVFVVALQLSFPYGRVKDKLIDALSDKYDVTIGDVQRGWMPGKVIFKAVTLRTRQTKPDEPITTFYIEKLEVKLGIFALLRGKASLDLDAKIGAGHIAGNVSVSKSGTSIDIEGTNLPGASLPMRMVLGLPMTGKIEFAVDLDLPNARNKAGRVGPDWTKAEGSFEISCPAGCTFGDGKTKLKPLLKNTRNQVMVGDGIDFGKVNIDSLVAKAVVIPANGTSKPAKLELKKFDAKSADGELKVDFEMTLAPSLDDSLVNGCLRFRGSDSLLKREPKTYAAIQTTGAELRADGLFHIKLTDHMKEMKRLNMQCGPGTNTNNGEDFSGNPGRPNLTIQPDNPPTPPAPPVTPPVTPPINPPPPTVNEGATPPPLPPTRPPGPDGEVPPVPSNGAGPTGAAPAPQPPNEALQPASASPSGEHIR